MYVVTGTHQSRLKNSLRPKLWNPLSSVLQEQNGYDIINS